MVDAMTSTITSDHMTFLELYLTTCRKFFDDNETFLSMACEIANTMIEARQVSARDDIDFERMFEVLATRAPAPPFLHPSRPTHRTGACDERLCSRH